MIITKIIVQNYRSFGTSNHMLRINRGVTTYCRNERFGQEQSGGNNRKVWFIYWYKRWESTVAVP